MLTDLCPGKRDLLERKKFQKILKQSRFIQDPWPEGYKDCALFSLTIRKLLRNTNGGSKYSLFTLYYLKVQGI